MRWTDRASCREMDTELFFGGNYETLKPICAACPVRKQCLDEELDLMRNNVATVGFRAGTTAEDRWAILGKGIRKTTIDHGSRRGYRQHRKLDVPMCDPCLFAKRQRDNDRALAKRRLHAVPE